MAEIENVNIKNENCGMGFCGAKTHGILLGFVPLRGTPKFYTLIFHISISIVAFRAMRAETGKSVIWIDFM